jgi:penicillin-binding protein 2
MGAKGNLGRERKNRQQVRLSGIEAEEAFFVPASPTRLGNFVLPRWTTRLQWLIWLTFLVFFVRAAHLQLFQGGGLLARAEETRRSSIPLPAPRGTIVDYFGEVLVRNEVRTDIFALPQTLPQDDTTLEEMSDILQAIFPHVSRADILRKLFQVRKTQEVETIIADITHEQRVAVEANLSRLPGIQLADTPVRVYDQSNAFAHLLGYTGRVSAEDRLRDPTLPLVESVGKDGLEARFDKELRGTLGEQILQINNRGGAEKVVGIRPPRPGQKLVLEIDAGLTRALAEALEEKLKELPTKRAAAVALDPRNGALRALVSFPLYDHTALGKGMFSPAALAELFRNPNQPLFNRAVAGTYPPGSTIKPFVAAAGLSAGIITAQTTINSTGGVRVGKWFFPDWKPGGHGRTDVVKALAESVNSFFYAVGGGAFNIRGLGIKRLNDALRKFGFGTETGFWPAREAKGLVPTPQWKEKVRKEKWYIGDTYHLSIGQGSILVSPLQLARAYAALLNGGILYQPRAVSRVEDENGKVMREFKPLVQRRNLVSPQIARVVRAGLRAAVLQGSARRLATLPLPLAGKTGTAQAGGNKETHAWLVSYAPADQPALVLVIVVEEGGAGDKVALPIAEKVWRWYIEHRWQKEGGFL